MLVCIAFVESTKAMHKRHIKSHVKVTSKATRLKLANHSHLLLLYHITLQRL